MIERQGSSERHVKAPLGVARGAWVPFIVWALLTTLAAGTFAMDAMATSSQRPETFEHLVSSMKLVIVAHVSGNPETGFRYAVDQVLKGPATSSLRFGPDPQAAVQPGWTLAVVAFTDPTTDDFRAPTIAWHVGSGGAIDPEGYQRYQGLPPTLDAMLAYFRVTPSATPDGASATPSPSAAPAAASPSVKPGAGLPSVGPSGALLALALAIGVLAFALVLAARRRPRRGQG